MVLSWCWTKWASRVFICCCSILTRSMSAWSRCDPDRPGAEGSGSLPAAKAGRASIKASRVGAKDLFIGKPGILGFGEQLRRTDGTTDDRGADRRTHG